MGVHQWTYIVLLLSISLVVDVSCVTNPNDLKILNDMRNGLENPELLEWGDDDDPCGSRWPHVYCSYEGRVTQIQVQNLGLKGPLPQILNQLDKLYNVGLQRNSFTGMLPSFNGLSDLQYAYLDFNEFDAIPADFFHGLASIRVLALDCNPFNQTNGWSLPSELGEATQLVNFSCSKCNLVGKIPEFFGKMNSLTTLRLAMNKLTGQVPSSFRGSMLQTLWLNDQGGGGLSGSIDVIGTMVGLTEVWLHGNQFTGSIPGNIGELTSLRALRLNRNRLVGLIPLGLASLNLQSLDLSGNMLMGPIPEFKASDIEYGFNSFCQPNPGEKCAPEVNALLDFLRDVNYPERLASQWTGNDPCNGPWWGITCDSKSKVSVMNLPNLGLNGTLSPSLASLPSLLDIHLQSNDLHGRIPESLTQLGSLRLLNISGNDFDPPLPKFRNGVNVVALDNPKLAPAPDKPKQLPSRPRVVPLPPSQPRVVPLPPSRPRVVPLPPSRPPVIPLPPRPSSSPTVSPELPPDKSGPRDIGPPKINPPTHSHEKDPISNPPTLVYEKPNLKNSKNVARPVIIGAVIGSAILIILAVVLSMCIYRKIKDARVKSSGVVIHPKDSSDHSNMVKISIIDNSAFEARDATSSTLAEMIEPNNLVISLQLLRKVTNDFSMENQLGRGGFGTVYKGELEDGTEIAVKRMESGSIGNKGLDEFRAEITVLSKVRHRNLVSLLGYSIEGNERLLVYEFMPRGALSRNLFRWRSLGLEPLSWAKRLVIALDVARGVEYLHTLTHQSFIHRDLKSANILLDNEFRAKVSDFGLVKLAPDRERSVATRLAGTFGYLAPEYAVTGKITTKVDVYSFGVVLMELLTGLMALDERRPEEKRYLAEWFWHVKSTRETLVASIDPSLDAKEHIYESIYSMAELAGHCTARDPIHRPDMGHIVNVLARLVDTWTPYEEADGYSGIDLMLPLPQMLKGWQEESDRSKESSQGSIPAKPSGFADSFTSADAR